MAKPLDNQKQYENVAKARVDLCADDCAAKCLL